MMKNNFLIILSLFICNSNSVLSNNNLDVPGCTNPNAVNFNPEATEDDGSCEGCGLIGFFNTCLDCDIINNSACIEYNYGCTDYQACNYSIEANVDIGLCDYPEEFYGCNGECINDTDGDFVCNELEIIGCTDSEACNFNPLATDDDNLCLYLDACGICGGDDSSCTGCMNPGFFNYCEACTIENNDSCIAFVYGCLDELACNFNEDANISSQNCSYLNDVCEACENGQIINNEIILSTQISDYNGFGVSCNGETDGYIDVTVTGGTGNYSYEWSNGASTEDVFDLLAGTYFVIVTDDNGCTSSIEVEITEPMIMTISETHSDYNGCGVSCYGNFDGYIDVTVTGGTGNYIYEWSNDVITEDLSDIGAGIYSVVVTDENGCSVSVDVEIVECESLSCTYTQENVLCYGNNNGSIDLTCVGETGEYIYNWSNGEVSEDLNNLSAGFYGVVITELNGCEYYLNIEILEPEEMVVSGLISNYTGFGVSCNGAMDGFIDLTVTGGTGIYIYEWSNGITSEDLTEQGAGMYSLVVTDENGCSVFSEFEILEPEEIVLQFTANDDFNYCYGDENGFIEWENVTGSFPFPVCEDDNEAALEIYTLNCFDLTSLYSCDFDFFSDLSVGELCPQSCGDCPDLLFGFDATIINYNTGQSYNYNTNSLPAGDYLVKLVDSRGCEIIENFTINQPNQVDLTFGYDCLGNCINDSDGDGICDEFEWSGCQDEEACNYSPDSTDSDDNLCDYTTCADDCGVLFGDNSSCTGCTIIGFCNYCSDCTIDDYESCIPNLNICTDQTACNFTEIDPDYPSECLVVCDECCEYPALGYDCNGNEVNTNIQEINHERRIIKAFDILGRRIDKKNNNKIILYLFDDGTIEKNYIFK
jgi:hypothetical protein